MLLVKDISGRARQAAPQVLAAVLVGYFLYHAVQGDRGVNAWLDLKAELAKAVEMRDELAARREALEKRVALLKPDHLDPDLLEERARVLLNYGHEDDYILFLPEESE